MWRHFRNKRESSHASWALVNLLYSTKIIDYFSKKEKQDIEDLEVPETKKYFLKLNTLENEKKKEEKEYLDALNKEVIDQTGSH